MLYNLNYQNLRNLQVLIIVVCICFTVELEFGALEKINDNYPKYLLTADSFTQNRNGVKHLNVFNWLLGTNDKHLL